MAKLESREDARRRYAARDENSCAGEDSTCGNSESREGACAARADTALGRMRHFAARAIVQDAHPTHAAVVALLFAVGMVAALGFDIAGIRAENVFIVFILGIVIAVIETNSAAWGILLGLAYPVAFDFLLIEPRFQLHAHDTGFFLSCGIFIVVALILGSLTMRLKSQLAIAQRDEEMLETLNKISTGLINSSSAEDACARSGRALSMALERGVSFHLGAPEKDDKAASLCFDASCPTGAGEFDFPSLPRKYLPLRAKAHTYGFVVVECAQGDLDEAGRSLLDSVITQTVIAIERNMLEDATRESKMAHDYARLKTNLLHAVSRNMKAPLLDISQTVGEIMHDTANPPSGQARDSLAAIEDDARVLLKTFDGLESIVRIEDPGMPLEESDVAIGDVVSAALARFEGRLGRHSLSVDIPTGDIVAPMNRPMIEQVIAQLVDNSLTHAYPDSSIAVTATAKLGMLSVSVSDNGGGIDPDRLSTVFNRFYVGDIPAYRRAKGMGFGLSICQSIVEAHDGFIVAENNRMGGATVTFALPLEER